MQKKKGKNSIKVLTLAMLLLLLSPASESISVKHLMIKLPSILLLKPPPPSSHHHASLLQTSFLPFLFKIPSALPRL